ncbi:MAG: serine hydrolase [Coprococcus sp.]|nr:serine hydrolase [Coprococcus sp.]
MRRELERVSPESVGIHSRDVLHFVEELEKTGAQMHGLMILRYGKVLAEGWWSPYAPGLRHGCQSLTKTYTSTAIGLLYDEGKVTLDERLMDIFPEETPKDPGERLRRMTVKDALCMSTGIYQFPDLTSKEWLKQYFAAPILKEPGEGFFYCSATSSLLAAVVREKTGQSLIEYLRPRLFEKIGIDADNLRILKMADGRDNGGGGLFSTTEDNARLMQLYLNQGMWDKERILSEEWVRMASSFQNATTEDQGIEDCRLGYGFQMWMCRPKGVYRADGAYGQYAIVFPELDMVISINELAQLGIWPQKILDIIWDEFMPKVAAGVSYLPEDEDAHRKLQEKMKGLTLARPTYRPQSKDAKKEPVSRWRLEENGWSILPSMYHNMTGLKSSGISEIRFDFSRTETAEAVFVYAGEPYHFLAGTDGNGRYNERLLKECVPQLTYVSGFWEDEQTFKMHLDYIETCFEKEFTFVFEKDIIRIEMDEANVSVNDLGHSRKQVYGHRKKE